jgi:hypothetical protein
MKPKIKILFLVILLGSLLFSQKKNNNKKFEIEIVRVTSLLEKLIFVAIVFFRKN